MYCYVYYCIFERMEVLFEYIIIEIVVILFFPDKRPNPGYCEVCGCTVAGYNYGVYSCEGCKVSYSAISVRSNWLLVLTFNFFKKMLYFNNHPITVVIICDFDVKMWKMWWMLLKGCLQIDTIAERLNFYNILHKFWQMCVQLNFLLYTTSLNDLNDLCS